MTGKVMPWPKWSPRWKGKMVEADEAAKLIPGQLYSFKRPTGFLPLVGSTPLYSELIQVDRYDILLFLGVFETNNYWTLPRDPDLKKRPPKKEKLFYTGKDGIRYELSLLESDSCLFCSFLYNDLDRGPKTIAKRLKGVIAETT